jgi:hypothetical protein
VTENGRTGSFIYTNSDAGTYSVSGSTMTFLSSRQSGGSYTGVHNENTIVVRVTINGQDRPHTYRR